MSVATLHSADTFQKSSVERKLSSNEEELSIEEEDDNEVEENKRNFIENEWIRNVVTDYIKENEQTWKIEHELPVERKLSKSETLFYELSLECDGALTPFGLAQLEMDNELSASLFTPELLEKAVKVVQKRHAMLMCKIEKREEEAPHTYYFVKKENFIPEIPIIVLPKIEKEEFDQLQEQQLKEQELKDRALIYLEKYNVINRPFNENDPLLIVYLICPDCTSKTKFDVISRFQHAICDGLSMSEFTNQVLLECASQMKKLHKSMNNNNNINQNISYNSSDKVLSTTGPSFSVVNNYSNQANINVNNNTNTNTINNLNNSSINNKENNNEDEIKTTSEHICPGLPSSDEQLTLQFCKGIINYILYFLQTLYFCIYHWLFPGDISILADTTPIKERTTHLLEPITITNEIFLKLKLFCKENNLTINSLIMSILYESYLRTIRKYSGDSYLLKNRNVIIKTSCGASLLHLGFKIDRKQLGLNVLGFGDVVSVSGKKWLDWENSRDGVLKFICTQSKRFGKKMMNNTPYWILRQSYIDQMKVKINVNKTGVLTLSNLRELPCCREFPPKEEEEEEEEEINNNNNNNTIINNNNGNNNNIEQETVTNNNNNNFIKEEEKVGEDIKGSNGSNNNNNKEEEEKKEEEEEPGFILERVCGFVNLKAGPPLMIICSTLPKTKRRESEMTLSLYYLEPVIKREAALFFRENITSIVNDIIEEKK